MLTTLIRWFQSPIFPENEDKSRSALLLNVILNTFLITLPVIFVGVLLGAPSPRFERNLISVACTWLMVLIVRLVMRTGRVIAAGIALVIIIFTSTTLAVHNIGTIRAPVTSFYLLAIVMSGLVISRRAIIWMAGLSTITIIALLLAEINGLFPQPNFTVSITQGVAFTVVFTIVSVLLYLAVKSIDEALARARQELAERKRAEEEREKYIEELNKRNAELVQFNYTVSHDLRNPLVTIKSFLGSLEKDLQDGRHDRLQSDFRRIANAADKMQTLLSQLLELSRIGRIANPPEEVDLVKLTQEALETLDAQIRSKNVTVNIAPDLPVIYGDRIRLREVLENLIDNAAKYMGDQKSPLIEIGKRDGSETVFYVRDNGMGIDLQYHTRIFNLFEKLNPTGEGTGIGLALIKRIIEVHGGRIWVESDGLGKGSTFCFTIPSSAQTL